MRIGQLGVALGTVLALAAVQGCGGGDDSSDASSDEGGSKAGIEACAAPQALVDAAEDEGQLVWYNSQNPEKAQEVIDAFEAKYAITVESLRLPSGQLSQRFLAEAASGNAPDVINVSDAKLFEQATEAGYLMELTPDDVPSVSNYPKDAIVNGTQALIGITPWQVIYNTDLTEEPPKTWDDLLKPEFKDQIVFVNPQVVPTALGMTQVWYDEMGPDWLEDFAAQDLNVVDSAVPGIQFLASGEDKVLVATEEGVAAPLIAEGAPLDTVLITPINGTQMFMGVSEKAPHPNAAKLLMNWVLCEEGQEEINSPNRTSPLDGVPNTVPLPDTYVSVDMDKAETHRDELVGLLGLK